MIALLLLAPVLAGQTMAADSPLSLLKRHHDTDSSAFIPDTTPGCPDDWPLCGDSGICYNPDEGQICCPGGTYACPSSSFCFLEPYCCPDSMGEESCAQQYGLALTTSYLLSNPTHSINPDFPPPPPPPTLPPLTSSASSITIRSTPIPTPESSLIAPWPSISIKPTSSVDEEEPNYTGAAPMALSSRGTKEVVTLGAIVFGLLRNFL